MNSVHRLNERMRRHRHFPQLTDSNDAPIRATLSKSQTIKKMQPVFKPAFVSRVPQVRVVTPIVPQNPLSYQVKAPLNAANELFEPKGDGLDFDVINETTNSYTNDFDSLQALKTVSDEVMEIDFDEAIIELEYLKEQFSDFEVATTSLEIAHSIKDNVAIEAFKKKIEFDGSGKPTNGPDASNISKPIMSATTKKRLKNEESLGPQAQNFVKPEALSGSSNEQTVARDYVLNNYKSNSDDNSKEGQVDFESPKNPINLPEFFDKNDNEYFSSNLENIQSNDLTIGFPNAPTSFGEVNFSTVLDQNNLIEDAKLADATAFELLEDSNNAFENYSNVIESVLSEEEIDSRLEVRAITDQTTSSDIERSKLEISGVEEISNDLRRPKNKKKGERSPVDSEVAVFKSTEQNLITKNAFVEDNQVDSGVIQRTAQPNSVKHSNDAGQNEQPQRPNSAIQNNSRNDFDIFMPIDGQENIAANFSSDLQEVELVDINSYLDKNPSIDSSESKIGNTESGEITNETVSLQDKELNLRNNSKLETVEQLYTDRMVRGADGSSVVFDDDGNDVVVFAMPKLTRKPKTQSESINDKKSDSNQLEETPKRETHLSVQPDGNSKSQHSNFPSNEPSNSLDRQLIKLDVLESDNSDLLMLENELVVNAVTRDGQDGSVLKIGDQNFEFSTANENLGEGSNTSETNKQTGIDDDGVFVYGSSALKKLLTNPVLSKRKKDRIAASEESNQKTAIQEKSSIKEREQQSDINFKELFAQLNATYSGQPVVNQNQHNQFLKPLQKSLVQTASNSAPPQVAQGDLLSVKTEAEESKNSEHLDFKKLFSQLHATYSGNSNLQGQETALPSIEGETTEVKPGPEKTTSNPLQLSERSRRFLKPLTGMDVNNIRIQRDAQTREVTDVLKADALAVGETILLSDKYTDESPEALGVIAHEMIHVNRRQNPRFVPPMLQNVGSGLSDEEALALNTESQVRHLARLEQQSQGQEYQIVGSNTHSANTESISGWVQPRPLTHEQRRDFGNLPPWELPNWMHDRRLPIPGQESPVSANQSVPSLTPVSSTNTPMTEAPSFIQAAAQGRNIPAAPPTPSAELQKRPAENEAGAGAAPAPDLDELAQQVYRRLKRRIAEEQRRQPF
jgi:Domain of unknown function (DUF4157)